MGGEVQRKLILTACLLALGLVCALLPATRAQEPGEGEVAAGAEERQEEPLREESRQDSLVRLVKGSSLRLIELDGRDYRQATDATFLHNGTYLVCDTAYWDVNDELIKAYGNVRMMQDETVLTSDKLDYMINDGVAQFRGGVVQLQDKDLNTLRTSVLDYRTKDSTAVFRDGATLKDKDGQIMESINGTYSTPKHLFTFTDEVNMFTDSVFIRTSAMEYNTDENKAFFTAPIDFRKEDNMLSAEGGWYDRGSEVFFFSPGVHATSRAQESWSDSLYLYRLTNDITLLGHAQVIDTTRNVAAVAGRVEYVDSIATLYLTLDAAIALMTEHRNDSTVNDTTERKLDTLYCGAEFIKYYTVPRCEVDSAEVAAAAERLSDMLMDPVREFRQKAAAEAAAKAEQARQEAEEKGLVQPRKKLHEAKPELPAADTAAAVPDAVAPTDTLPPVDSLAPMDTPVDSLAPADTLVAADTLAVEVPDSSRIGFMRALKNVRMYRFDMQMRCDSLVYCDLDSIARLFVEPIVWNEGSRQYTADSIALLVKDGHAHKANLMSNAFVATQEDPTHFDQIRSIEMQAYFDTSMTLIRYDALGGVDALFYLEENGELATVNRVNTKMLSAYFLDGQIDRIHYFESPKNDAFPTAQLSAADSKLKGFSWQEERQPGGKEDITSLEFRESQREVFHGRPEPAFVQTGIYFPGYMAGIYSEIAVRDSINRWNREHPEEAAADSTAAVAADSAAVEAADSLSGEAGAAAGAAISEASDSASAAPAVILTEKERLRQERLARKEARWRELDRLDSLKAAEKKLKALEKNRERTRKLWVEREKQNRKDRAKLEVYIKRYERKKARKTIDARTDSGEVSQVREGQDDLGREFGNPTELPVPAGSVENAQQ